MSKPLAQRHAAAKLAKMAVSLGVVLMSMTAAAESAFPSKPVTLVVGFTPGGSNDIVARAIAPKFSEALGVPVVVENRPGANATIGTEYVVRAKPDGYTLTLGSASPLAISPHTYRSLPYDPLVDLRPITAVAQTPELIAVNTSVGVKSLSELLELAATRELAFSSSGAGGLPHLAIELLKSEAKGRITHVPYKGAAPAATDAAGGHVDGIIMDVPALLGLVESKKLVPIAVAHDQRSNVLPDVPTTAEGGLPQVLAFNWFAVMAPAKTPDDVVRTLHKALLTAAEDPTVKSQLANQGIEPFTQSSPEEARQFMESEAKRWGDIAKRAGVEPL